MPLKLVKYISHIQKQTLKFESLDLNGKLYKGIIKRNLRKIVSVILSVLIIYKLENGFNTDFIQYVTTILSIFIGLFATALIFGFDKFYTKIEDEKIESASAELKLYQIKSYNFSKKFAYITGYNILLSVISILLLLLSVLFKKFFTLNISDFNCVFENLNYTHIINFLAISFVVIQRFFVLYWLISIFYFTLYLISSLVIFMIEKYDIE